MAIKIKDYIEKNYKSLRQACILNGINEHNMRNALSGKRAISENMTEILPGKWEKKTTTYFVKVK